MNTHKIEEITATPLPSLLNFRDVGETINRLHNGSTLLRKGVIFRSARPDDATPSDRSALTSEYHIKTIIDLRSTTEHIEQAEKRDAAAHASVFAVNNGQQAVDVVNIDDIDYREINLNGGAFALALLWKLRWSSLARFMSLMAFGHRSRAIGILGKEVMAPRGLIGLGEDTLDHSSKELYEIFSVLADSNSYPLLVHCTQGKDRTGLVVVLLLLLLKVPIDSIVVDYLASEKQLDSEQASRLAEIRQMGLPDDFIGCPDNFVEEVKNHLDSVYGGLEKYFEAIGVDNTMQAKIRENTKATRSDQTLT